MMRLSVPMDGQGGRYSLGRRSSVSSRYQNNRGEPVKKGSMRYRRQSWPSAHEYMNGETIYWIRLLSILYLIVFVENMLGIAVGQNSSWGSLRYLQRLLFALSIHFLLPASTSRSRSTSCLFVHYVFFPLPCLEDDLIWTRQSEVIVFNWSSVWKRDSLHKT